MIFINEFFISTEIRTIFTPTYVTLSKGYFEVKPCTISSDNSYLSLGY